MKKFDINKNLLDMARWHGILDSLDSNNDSALWVPCPTPEEVVNYSNDIISKCLELIDLEYDISNKPVHETEFFLDDKLSKVEHYNIGRKQGIKICRKVIEEYFGL